jgi:hypothetical protein
MLMERRSRALMRSRSARRAQAKCCGSTSARALPVAPRSVHQGGRAPGQCPRHEDGEHRHRNPRCAKHLHAQQPLARVSGEATSAVPHGASPSNTRRSKLQICEQSRTACHESADRPHGATGGGPTAAACKAGSARGPRRRRHTDDDAPSDGHVVACPRRAQRAGGRRGRPRWQSSKVRSRLRCSWRRMASQEALDGDAGEELEAHALVR